MYYYCYKDKYYCSWEKGLPLPSCPEPQNDSTAWSFLFSRPLQSCRSSFAVSAPGQLTQVEEGAHWLDLNQLAPARDIPPYLRHLIEQRRLMAINHQHPHWDKLAEPPALTKKKRVHVLAMGDVGSTLTLGLRLLGAEQIDSIGIYDINENLSRRWEFELNQVATPAGAAAPPVEIIGAEQLFAGDVFVFCATAGLPPLGAAVDDVRLAQLHGNRNIIGIYARQARQANFNGLFAVVSDPVDLLCQAALMESNCGPQGCYDGLGLRPEQIQGYGLGVMQARAAYYARQEQRFSSYLTEGLAFGPHGKGLVIANSLQHYDDAISQELTELTTKANLELRKLGYKPYVAPAISSGATPLIATLAGDWHYSCTYLGGLFMGAQNRITSAGLETDAVPMPPPLYKRIRQTADYLLEMGAL
jgi:hypothetical protein